MIVATTGHTRDELLRSHISLVLADDDITHITRVNQRHLAGTDANLPTVKLPVETADGDEIPCELRFNLLVEDGEVQGTVGVVRDGSTIAKRKQREQKLVRYESIVETVEGGIYILDEAYRFTTVNQDTQI